jgi:uncharacterized LabA/DUF88 family protein
MTLQGPYSRAADLLGAAGLLGVVHDALDQDRLRTLYERINAGRGQRAAAMNKEALCTAVVRLALNDKAILELACRELGRASSKEIAMVAGLPEDALRDRVLALPAMQLRRPRMRVMWALSTDERGEAQALAREMLQALERAVSEAQSTQKPSMDPGRVQRNAQEIERVTRAAERQQEGLQAQLGRMERERADALAQLGAKEAQLRDEVTARAELEREAALANARARELETTLAESRAEVTRLRDNLRVEDHTRQRGLRQDTLLSRLQETSRERDAQAERADELERQLARLVEQQRALANSLVARDSVAQERIRRLRESLRDVRRQRARPGQTPVDEANPHVERVGVHIDVSNLAASANRYAGRKVDFMALVSSLCLGRAVARAVAYAVEQGDPEKFAGFCAALRAAGIEVKVKKPVTRADGSTKADWDMGLAMEVVEDAARVDTVIVCSGDGDFLPLLQLMRRRGKRVEVAAFRQDTHDELARCAHAFHPLADSVLA